MSVATADPYYTSEITLIDKTQPTVNNISVDGDLLRGNLTKWRVSLKNTETSMDKTRNATLTLRAPGGLFTTIAPILIDENARDSFEIDIERFQPVGNDPKGLKSPLFRYEISKAEQVTGEGGTYVILTLTAREIRLEQNLDASRIELQDPKAAFIQRVVNTIQPGNPVINIGVDTNIALPDTANLNQNWVPLQPTSTKKLLNEIITRISRPEQIGSTNFDHYYYFVDQPNNRQFIDIFAEKFGEQDSGVVLDEIRDLADSRTLQTQQSAEIDHSKLHNVIILRGASGAHTLPMEFTRLASDLEHARIADLWTEPTNYVVGDFVRHNNVRYKCVFDHTSSTTVRPNTSAFWENLETATRS